MADPLSSLLFNLQRRGMTPYTGPTHGVEKLHPGTKFYQGTMPGYSAQVPVGQKAVVVAPDEDLTLPKAMHEAMHLYQNERMGAWANPITLAHRLLARLQGKDPMTQTPEEEQGYRVQSGVEKQMRDKAKADEDRKLLEAVQQFVKQGGRPFPRGANPVAPNLPAPYFPGKPK